jgi:hypothetical protein
LAGANGIGGLHASGTQPPAHREPEPGHGRESGHGAAECRRTIAPTPTLSSEQLTVSGGGSLGCVSSGSFSFSVSGLAAGPYAGTFTEAVTGSVSGSTMTTLTATFTIQSATGNVTGATTLIGSPTGCRQSATTFGTIDFVPTTYQATIHTPNGNFTDHGTASMDFLVSGGTPNQFSETFTSSLPGVLPTNRDQCKDAGWQGFAPFKNQGQCVSFVEHTT